MAQCFCGCGQKVRFGNRSVNKRGAMINGDLSTVRMMLARGLQSPSGEMYVHDGDLLCEQLAQAVHASTDPAPELERVTRGFLAFSRVNFGTAAFGARIRGAGFSPDEAMTAIFQGDWDPFADVALPQ